MTAFLILSAILASTLIQSTTTLAASTLTKVAVSSATASSYEASNTPSRAIDETESTNNYWGTNALATDGRLPQWLQLDLGTQKSISQIITHFYDGDSRTYTYYIQASATGSSWTTTVPTKTGSRSMTDTFTPVTARYVRITITGNTANLAAHIEEAKIYQSTNPTPSPTATPNPTPTPAPTSTPTTTLTKVAVSSATASSYEANNTPSRAIDGTESTNNYWGTNALATDGRLPQWLQLDLGTQKSISQIITHFYDGDSRTYTYYIQASATGSSWTTTVPTKTGSRSITDTFTPVTARYVRITITGNTANLAAHIEEAKIYQSTNPTPSPTPTSTPSPTNSPAPSPNSQNLAVIPSGWSLTYGNNPQIIFLDSNVVHTAGKSSIRIEPHTSADMNQYRECDGKWYSIKPGDHIVAKCWMRTDSGYTGAYEGARFAIDFYGSTGQLVAGAFWNNYYQNDFSRMYVRGTTWQQKTIDFIVPAQVGDANGNMHTPTSFVLWLQGRPETGRPGNVWFADAELYINP